MKTSIQLVIVIGTLITACAGLISTITHENIEYNIVNALTDLHGVDGPLHNFVSDNAVRIGHTNIANDSPRKVGFYTNLPGSTYVLWLDPGEKGTLHFNKDYPWVLASGEPRANLNKEIYEILVPQVINMNEDVLGIMTFLRSLRD
ncbi:hypothetical protein MJO28_007394 [Puccinia striiformis f. sp. tritici]|uniref:Uncharacterized protein n=3 Tax=Puccinia striiformis TaxID=27350 RepID=A0A2S4WAX4_9BASI|nr:hypothetical protein Pst134EA_033446 [Puccinia striiformis f. sp. tritici]KAI9613224.1 hypothetical protein KEM48_003857 [Puccinia striiformis f. sp. tritici PST-130]POW10121.1 hypothetical protein PSTT_06340 [Puccinia striiformis]KAH9454406.1 hypothetical protein Pst134EB_033479 [Puccinia striiformis f. sp. tritici]KAH9465621.1 hypothetical protein Pst134EA_033446 [Puccinia striiformis f. sp. tritici]KAI7951710.1 hypothetical protein MJO28_007394 [Puccinia striiformis f. sp. tritici]